MFDYKKLPYWQNDGNYEAEKAIIKEMFLKMKNYLASHESICVGVSGGSDSDTIIHIIATYFREYLDKVYFVFCNTGLEYKATKEHLEYLEKRYNIQIKRLTVKDGVVPVPLAVKKYGTPLCNKWASQMFERLQKHGFDFKDKPLNKLLQQYPNCKGAIRWWCNDYGTDSQFNIDRYKNLKGALVEMEHVPKISAKCCDESKKKPMHKYQLKIKADLSVTGERKSEGGIRATKHKSCFECGDGKIDKYMPLFWWDDETKQYFKETEGIRYSDCYEVWGMKRTGCTGCPYGLNLKDELDLMKQFEPNMYKACVNVFGESYKLMDEVGLRKFKVFDDQITMFDEERYYGKIY